MTMTDALQTTKTKKRTLFAGALAAGLLTLGLSGGTAAASSYGGYGGYGGYNSSNDVNSSYDKSTTAYYKASQTYAQSTDYSEDNSCYASNYNRYGGWHYGSNYGSNFACNNSRDYSNDVYYNAEVEAYYNTNESADFNLSNNYNNYMNRYW